MSKDGQLGNDKMKIKSKLLTIKPWASARRMAHLLERIYYVGTVLSILQVFNHLILATVL